METGMFVLGYFNVVYICDIVHIMFICILRVIHKLFDTIWRGWGWSLCCAWS